MKKNFVKSRWLFTMLLFVTTMIMPTMMLAQSITPTPPKGDGKAEPYQISTAAELYWFAGLVNGTLEGVKQDASANANLTKDITVNEGVLDASKDPVNGKDFIPWTPIGKSSHCVYTGTFNGNGHTISGLYFNKPKAYNVGLFGYIGANGKISNVGVLDSYFQFGANGGGVCGRNEKGKLQNCFNSSTVIGNVESHYYAATGGVCGHNEDGGIIENCFNEGTVSGIGCNVGGVCGYNEGREYDYNNNKDSGIIENCFNKGTVSGTVDYVGGVCGYNDGKIKSCYNTASVSGQNYVGGVCGNNSSGTTTTNCFNEGSVSGTGYSVGGVCGQNWGRTTNCFNEGTISGTGNSIGGVCGADYSGTITNCYYLSGTVADGKGGLGGRDDESGKAEKRSKEQFESGEVAWLLNGKGLGEQVWGQQLGEDLYPVPGSDYKVIKAAQGDMDANGHYTYWATFSNQTNDVTLSVPSESGRTLNVYNATVSGGKLTLTQRSDDQVAKGEGVLLKTDGEYVNAINAKANETNELTAASSDENNLVATPPVAQTVPAETGYILYRLTYNDAKNKKGLGFYLGVDEDNNSSDGSRLKATPGKAYLKVSVNAAKAPSSAALTRSFVFGGGSETTGIDEITIMGTDVQRHGTFEGIFDLQGRKISNPTKGIYIKNNKKVIIK